MLAPACASKSTENVETGGGAVDDGGGVSRKVEMGVEGDP